MLAAKKFSLISKVCDLAISLLIHFYIRRSIGIGDFKCTYFYHTMKRLNLFKKLKSNLSNLKEKLLSIYDSVIFEKRVRHLKIFLSAFVIDQVLGIISWALQVLGVYLHFMVFRSSFNLIIRSPGSILFLFPCIMALRVAQLDFKNLKFDLEFFQETYNAKDGFI